MSFYNITKAADKLQVSERTLRRLTKEYGKKSARLGTRTHLFYTDAELAEIQKLKNKK